MTPWNDPGWTSPGLGGDVLLVSFASIFVRPAAGEVMGALVLSEHAAMTTIADNIAARV